jgi:hypothetical protein
MSLSELAERCEKATGPDRELSAAIALTVHDWLHEVEGNKPLNCRIRNRFGSLVYIGSVSTDMDYTASIDAAMKLVPEGCSATVWTAGPRGFTTGPAARLFSYPKDPEAEGGYAIRALSDHEITAATPALAVCAAALRARGAVTNEDSADTHNLSLPNRGRGSL